MLKSVEMTGCYKVVHQQQTGALQGDQCEDHRRGKLVQCASNTKEAR